MPPNITSPVNLSPAMFGISSNPAAASAMMGGSPTSGGSAAGGGHHMQGQTGAPPNLSALMTQQRLLELSGFNLRGYDLAQHMLSQQSNVSKLLGECKSTLLFYFNYLYPPSQCRRSSLWCAKPQN